MTLNITIPNNINDTKPRITVIGIGGAGGNAVNTMINSKVENIEFIVANTDGQALSHSLTKRQIQLGKNLTLGLGAGSNAETGKKAAEESIDEIISELGDINMLFIATGMGGGTGSGAAPIIAKAAKDKGILTIAVVTKPFDFEGKKRMQVAENGLKQLKDNVDTLIIIPNQNLFKIANEKTTFSEAFKLADDVLYQGVFGITDLITNPGIINLDFADIRTVMGNMGKAMMGTGESSGENRAQKAAEAALNNPLLDDSNIKGAKSILLNIKGGPDMSLFEVDEAASKIRNEVDEDANIIFGSSIDEKLEGIIKVSIVATGIDNSIDKTYEEESDINLDQFLLSPDTDKSNQNKMMLNINTINDSDNIKILTEKKVEQIDLETQINNLKEEKDVNQNDEKKALEKSNINDLISSLNRDELLTIIDKKPDNNFTNNKQHNIISRISTFFKKEENEERIIELDIKNKNTEPKKTIQNKTLISNNFKEEKNDITDKKKNFVDFKESTNVTDYIDNQIDLIDIEQNINDIDKNILEIPAFLRRQAN
tara:strand:- start:5 stop:1627 length:1623 start_codon:yes stop_codon:yes gene_type:complete